jgi:hypothetical protein
MNWFTIKAFVNKIKKENMNKDFNTKPGFVERRMAQLENEIQKLKAELNEWEGMAPVNGMGAFARQTRIKELKARIAELENPFIDDPNDLTIDAYNENAVINEYFDLVSNHDYTYYHSDDNDELIGDFTAGRQSENRIEVMIHTLCAMVGYDAERLLEETLEAVPEQYTNGLTHKTIRNWFTHYIENKQ